ncbi:MAG: hypothetical protein RJA09_2078, partial [Pseudomonadota bacterium]
VGLDHVKAKILDDHEGRRALWAQLQAALDGEPDPWFEFAKAEVDVRQFSPLEAPLTAPTTHTAGATA